MIKRILVVICACMLSKTMHAYMITDDMQPCPVVFPDKGLSDQIVAALSGDVHQGYRLIVGNATSQRIIKGEVHLFLSDHDDPRIEIVVPQGHQFLMNSCALRDRLGGASQTAMDIAGKAGGDVVGTVGAEVIPVVGGDVAKALFEGVMKTQGNYPVCYKSIRFDFFVKSSKQVKTYTYNFPGLTGACTSMVLDLIEKNGELVLIDANNKSEFTWSKVEVKKKL